MNKSEPKCISAFAHLYGTAVVHPTPNEWVTFMFMFDGAATVMYVSPVILQPENKRLYNRMMQYATIVTDHTFTSPIKDRFGLAKAESSLVLTVEGAEERFQAILDQVLTRSALSNIPTH